MGVISEIRYVYILISKLGDLINIDFGLLVCLKLVISPDILSLGVLIIDV